MLFTRGTSGVTDTAHPSSAGLEMRTCHTQRTDQWAESRSEDCGLDCDPEKMTAQREPKTPKNVDPGPKA